MGYFNVNYGKFTLPEVDGYKMILPQTIGRYFEHARGFGPDLFIVKHYTEGGATEMLRGIIPRTRLEQLNEKELDCLCNKQTELSSWLDHEEKRVEAIRFDRKIYQSLEHDFSIIIVQCKDGLIGCGWFDYARTAKRGLKMAAFLLYTIGILNVEYDKTLWEMTWSNLPYDVDIGRTEVIEKIIADSMKDDIIKANTDVTIEYVEDENDDDDEKQH